MPYKEIDIYIFNGTFSPGMLILFLVYHIGPCFVVSDYAPATHAH